MDDGILREKARELVEAAGLAGRSRHIWGGSSVGNECTVCGLRIERDETELEVEFKGRDDPRGPILQFHVHCFSVLESELVVVEAAARAADERRHLDETP